MLQVVPINAAAAPAAVFFADSVAATASSVPAVVDASVAQVVGEGGGKGVTREWVVEEMRLISLARAPSYTWLSSAHTCAASLDCLVTTAAITATKMAPSPTGAETHSLVGTATAHTKCNNLGDDGVNGASTAKATQVVKHAGDSVSALITHFMPPNSQVCTCVYWCLHLCRCRCMCRSGFVFVQYVCV